MAKEPVETGAVAKKSAAKKAAAKKAPAPPISAKGDVWDYYEVQFKFSRECLATCAETSIMAEHKFKKAQKEIKKANKLQGKINKIAEKFRGAELSDEKMVRDTQALINTYAELCGETVAEMPDDMDELLDLAAEVEAKYHEIVAKAEQSATVFMRKKIDGKKGGGKKGLWPVMSSHMFLGNLKENARIITNNGDKSIFPSKVSIGEVLSLDVKPVEPYMIPSHDIVRKEDGERDLLERPIRFTSPQGKEQTAISISERLPVGTEINCTLRVRRRGPVTQEALTFLLELGKNNGLGAWRGSGNMGAYWYKLTKLDKNYKEPVPEGFEGWS